MNGLHTLAVCHCHLVVSPQVEKWSAHGAATARRAPTAHLTIATAGSMTNVRLGHAGAPPTMSMTVAGSPTMT